MTTSQTRRVLAAGAAAAAIGLIGAAPAGAADLAGPKVTTSGGQSVIKFLSHTTEESFTTKDGKTVAGEPNKQPEVGDSFGFNDTNSQDGTKIGTDVGKCTVVASTKKGVTSHCVVTVTFANGTLMGEGDTVFSEEDTPFTIPITGGTGAYAGAHGTARVVDVNDDDSDLTMTFSTAAAGSDGQVSATPVGGAAAGGGSTAAGGDNSSLFALGGIGMAAGAMLFAAGRRSGRRST